MSGLGRGVTGIARDAANSSNIEYDCDLLEEEHYQSPGGSSYKILNSHEGSAGNPW